jgi:peptidoglycan hydrolase-like protein with peptidoglycan-binding domain
MYVAPAPPAPPALALGDRGEAVTDLQRALARYGFGIKPTGIYDEATVAIVTAFQRHFRRALVDGRPTARPSTRSRRCSSPATARWSHAARSWRGGDRRGRRPSWQVAVIDEGAGKSRASDQLRTCRGSHIAYVSQRLSYLTPIQPVGLLKLRQENILFTRVLTSLAIFPAVTYSTLCGGNRFISSSFTKRYPGLVIITR